MCAVFQQGRMRQILETIEFGPHITIQDLAVKFKLSPSHLQHLFKAQTGSRLGRRLAEYRLQKAACLLLDTDLSVKEIAFAVGYKHASSFVRAFERYYQLAPGQFRQEMLTERQFG